MSQEVAAEVAYAPVGSPFKFLDFFGDSEDDARRFAGRDREVQELTALIIAERTLVLYGEAGCGKTSLVLAGVFPALRHLGFFPVYARILSDPVEDLKLALLGGGQRGDIAAGLEVDAAALAAADGRPLVLVLDQFEEFFIRFQASPMQRQRFLAAVNALARQAELQLRLVFSLRKDYLAELDDLGDILVRRRLVEYRLRSLTPFGARQVILAQLARGAVAYDDGVVTPLVARLAEFRFDPLILQIYGYELYTVAVRRAKGAPPRITPADLAEVGSLDSIVARYLDGVANAIPSAHHLLMRLILNALITYEGTKRATSLDDLLGQRFATDVASVQLVLTALKDHHIVRSQLRGRQEWYELVHERLVPRLQEWMNRDREFKDFAQAQAMVHDHCKGELWRRNPDALLREGILTDLIEPRRDQFRFEDLELEYLFCSVLLCRLGSLPYWAGRCGMEKATGIVERWMSDCDGEQRAAAAAAAGVLEEAWKRLGKVCVSLALNDEKDEVWQAAARALGKRAAEPELAELHRATLERAHRLRTRAVLGYMRERGHSLPGFGLWRRRRATRDAERIAVREHREELAKRRKTGALYGGVGGLLWSFTLAPLLMALASGEVLQPHSVDEWARKLALSLAAVSVALPLGVLLGWWAAGSSGRQALLHGEGRWLAVAGRGLKWLVATVAATFFVTAVFAGVMQIFHISRYNLDGGPQYQSKSLFLTSWQVAVLVCLSLSVIAALFVLGSLLAASIRTSLGWLSKGTAVQLRWLLLGVVPALVLSALVAHLVTVAAKDPTILLGTWACMAAALSFSTLAMASSLLASSARHPLGELPTPGPDHRQAVQRIVLLAGLILVLVWYGFCFGWKVIPPLARALVFDPRAGITIPFSSDARTVEFVRIRNESAPQVLEITATPCRDADGSSTCSVDLGTNVSADAGERMVLPTGTFLASLHRNEGLQVRGALTLAPLPPLALDPPELGVQRGIKLSGPAALGGVIALKPETASVGTEVWSGTLYGTIQDPQKKVSIAVSLQFLASQVQGGVQLRAATGDPAKPTTVRWTRSAPEFDPRLGPMSSQAYRRRLPTESDWWTVEDNSPISLELIAARGVSWEAPPAVSGVWWTRFVVQRALPAAHRIPGSKTSTGSALVAVVVTPSPDIK